MERSPSHPAEQLLSAVLSQLPAVVWTVDEHFCFTSIHGARMAALSLTPEKVLGRTVAEILPRPEALEAHAVALAGQSSRYGFSSTMPDGSELVFETYVSPLRASEGATNGAIGIAVDVTERVRLEEQFRHAQKMEAIGLLAGGVAHDFNNMLTAIQSFATFVAEDLPEGSQTRGDVEEIQKAARRAERLTQQLLAFSRQRAVTPQRMSVNEVISDLERMLRRILEENIILETVLDPELWHAEIDPAGTEQVLINLAINARDAMPSGGRLVIETKNVIEISPDSPPDVSADLEEWVSISVIDTGTGMTKEIAGRIFEPFFTTKPKGKGTGLGLSTCYGIVQQAGGFITVDSEPNKGARFSVHFPRAEQAEEAESDIPAPAHLEGTETILVAEDEEPVRRLTVRLLQRLGYRVIEASDGHQALASTEGGHPIDLLLTDVVMPGLSGPELARAVLAQRPALKVLFMSGYAAIDMLDTNQAARSGVLIHKPFTPSSLARKVREVLNGV